MTPLLLLLLAASPEAPKRFDACMALVKTDPAKAVIEADAWRVQSGGVPARQCLGAAFAAQDRWSAAALSFEQGAREAALVRDGRAATLWVQAGNAALAGGDAGRARAYFDSALALPTLSEPMRGEAHLDRARAQVELGSLAAARSDIDQAIKLVPADPLVWLLSANLALRQKDVARAQKDIAEAARLAPDDAEVALQAGNVAAAAGVREAAEVAWRRAAELAPSEPAGAAAKQHLSNRAPDK